MPRVCLREQEGRGLLRKQLETGLAVGRSGACRTLAGTARGTEEHPECAGTWGRTEEPEGGSGQGFGDLAGVGAIDGATVASEQV